MVSSIRMRWFGSCAHTCHEKMDWTAIKNRVIIENERVKFLAKVSVDIDIKTGEVSFSLPDFGLTSKDTIIEDNVWGFL